MTFDKKPEPEIPKVQSVCPECSGTGLTTDKTGLCPDCQGTGKN